MTARTSAEKVHNIVQNAKDFTTDFQYEAWHNPDGTSRLLKDEMTNIKVTRVTTLEYEDSGCVFPIHSDGSRAWAEFPGEDEDHSWMLDHLDQEAQKAMTACINILPQEDPAQDPQQPQPQNDPCWIP